MKIHTSQDPPRGAYQHSKPHRMETFFPRRPSSGTPCPNHEPRHGTQGTLSRCRPLEAPPSVEVAMPYMRRTAHLQQGTLSADASSLGRQSMMGP
eukprot:CAMPEP_0115668344 /NCGR_PEP_ID=MMETSP0272-20121206/50417_1 /TAXON_ID=71861 /ORGANISM="Scrippsiella trochoidea, Strain CCMP3099" /LENGTH=94 /DNA_ID=CAMNT_0003106939 /DNA_START=255 /DNA_END=539 /DNA_ORIENTATION=+